MFTQRRRYRYRLKPPMGLVFHARRRCSDGDSSLVRVSPNASVVPIEVGPLAADVDFLRRARVLASIDRCGGGVACLESAALIHKIPYMATNPDVHLLVDRTCRKRLNLPSLKVGRTRLREAQVIRHEWVVPPHVERIGGVWVTSVEQTILDMLRLAPPADAVAFGCMALRKLVGFDRDDPKASYSAAQKVSARIYKCLRREYPPDRRFRQAERLLDLLTPAVDSVLEAVMVWVCYLAGLPRAKLQERVWTGTGCRYIDAFYPQALVALEFDGRIKLGFSAEAAMYERTRQLHRDRELESLGIHVVHVSSDEVGNFTVLVARLRRELFSLGVGDYAVRGWITTRMRSWRPRGSTGWF